MVITRSWIRPVAAAQGAVPTRNRRGWRISCPLLLSGLVWMTTWMTMWTPAAAQQSAPPTPTPPAASAQPNADNTSSVTDATPPDDENLLTPPASTSEAGAAETPMDAAHAPPVISDEQAKARGWKRLTKTEQVWVDKKHSRVIVGGAVCHRRGPLEMFACPPHTKEYESVVVVFSKAFVIHAALLAVGAEPGNPVQFVPTYVPARGTTIEIDVLWQDANGKQQKARAQQWVRQVTTQKAMPYDWVFAGSGFWVDEETKQRHYRAEGGDLICVSNFPSAMLDLPVQSSDSNEGLMFEAFTENIPAEGTQVVLILRPRADAVPKATNTDATDTDATDSNATDSNATDSNATDSNATDRPPSSRDASADGAAGATNATDPAPGTAVTGDNQ